MVVLVRHMAQELEGKGKESKLVKEGGIMNGKRGKRKREEGEDGRRERGRVYITKEKMESK